MMHFGVACILIVAAFVSGYIYGAKRERRGRHKNPIWEMILGTK